MSSKKSKSADAATYEHKDVVLAKIRGFPAWPCMIVDPDTVPSNVAKERPGKGKTSFYCVRFFPAGDYAWVLNKDISKLKTHEIEAYINEPSKKSGDLLEGYKIALDPHKWLSDLESVRMELEEAEANAEVDELDGEEEAVDDDDGKPKTKKRKRESEAAADKKKASKPKKEKAEKATNGAESKKKGAAAAKSGKKSNKSKTLVESEDEADGAPAGSSKKDAAPPSKKAKKDKDDKKDEDEDSPFAKDPEAMRIKNWRHTFQRALLGKTPPKVDELAGLSELLTTVEEYDGYSIEYLSFSKIGKVMRHIAVLPDNKAPKDDEYKFRERAKALVDKWQSILNASKSGNGETANGDDKEHPTGKATRGAKRNAKAAKDEKDEAIAAAEADLEDKPDQTAVEADASIADMTMAED